MYVGKCFPLYKQCNNRSVFPMLLTITVAVITYEYYCETYAGVFRLVFFNKIKYDTTSQPYSALNGTLKRCIKPTCSHHLSFIKDHTKITKLIQLVL